MLECFGFAEAGLQWGMPRWKRQSLGVEAALTCDREAEWLTTMNKVSCAVVGGTLVDSLLLGSLLHQLSRWAQSSKDRLITAAASTLDIAPNFPPPPFLLAWV